MSQKAKKAERRASKAAPATPVKETKKVTIRIEKKYTLPKVLPWILVIGGIIGGLAAAILMVEKIELIKHPHVALACDLNPIVACGAVINTPQASAFGFPNPIIGLIGFGIVVTVGMALLAGAQFKRWFWLGLQAGVTFGVGFITWLQYQTIYHINALCPYCMVVWSVTIPIFWYVTLYNLRNGHIKTSGRGAAVSAFLQRHHVDVLLVWYTAIAAAIFTHFWYYWSTLL